MKWLYRLFVAIYSPIWVSAILVGALWGTVLVGFGFGKEFMLGDEPGEEAGS